MDLERLRQVATEEGEALARKWGNCSYLEASAKTQLHVVDIFHKIIRRVREDKRAKALVAGESNHSYTEDSCKCSIT